MDLSEINLEDVIGAQLDQWKIVSIVLSKSGIPIGVMGECSTCKTTKRITRQMLTKKQVPHCGVCYATSTKKKYKKPGRKKEALRHKHPIEYRIWKDVVEKDCVKSWLRFSKFLYDMGKRPAHAHRIEKKDKKKPYSAANTIWRYKPGFSPEELEQQKEQDTNE